MTVGVRVYRDVRSYEKDRDDTSHVGWVATLEECRHLVKYHPFTARIRTADGSLPLAMDCPTCVEIARAAVTAR